METELAKYGLAGVSLALIGVLFYVIRFLLTEVVTVLKELSKNVKINSVHTKEGNKFLKNLNGELKKSIKRKVK